jgi:hypothetical protein
MIGISQAAKRGPESLSLRACSIISSYIGVGICVWSSRLIWISSEEVDGIVREVRVLEPSIDEFDDMILAAVILSGNR